MTDLKPTDEEVIKALECCSSEETEGFICEKCPYINKGCNINLLRDSLAIINCQKAELEMLRKPNKKLKVLELFAGTRSIGKAFEARGHEVFSIEWDKSFDDIDLYADIMTVTAADILKKIRQARCDMGFA